MKFLINLNINLREQLLMQLLMVRTVCIMYYVLDQGSDAMNQECSTIIGAS